MLKNDTMCEDCSHDKVCKDKDSYVSFIDVMRKDYYEQPLGLCVRYGKINVALSCKNFLSGNSMWSPGVRGVVGKTEPTIGCETSD